MRVLLTPNIPLHFPEKIMPKSPFTLPSSLIYFSCLPTYCLFSLSLLNILPPPLFVLFLFLFIFFKLRFHWSSFCWVFFFCALDAIHSSLIA